MTGTIVYRNVVFASGTWTTVTDYIGRGALRDIRFENLANSGPRISGVDRLRITVDRTRGGVAGSAGYTGGYILGSGMIIVPYLGTAGIGQYLCLPTFILNADYHEPGLLVSGSDQSEINDTRVPFHESLLVEVYLNTSGVTASGLSVNVWVEDKGQ